MQVSQNSKLRWIKISFGLSIVLTITKFVAYYFTNSNAILSDALESIINVLASGFAFYSINLASKPRDGNHPYGHGKIEYFSSGFEGALIIIAGIWIIEEAVGRLLNAQSIQNLGLGGGLIAITAIANVIVGNYLQKVGKETRSEALMADGKHLITDSYSSVIILTGLILVYFTGLIWIDAAASILLSIFIFYNGYWLIRTAVSALMDETDLDLVNQVVGIIKQNKREDWIDVHNLRVQKYGSDLHIDCHLTLPYYWDLKQVHESVHSFEEIFEAENSGQTEIFIHADPCLPECCKYCRIECTVRTQTYEQEIDWSAEKLIKNQKLFVGE